ncbi:MAG: protein kinase, partial [Chlamydiia bacterium]|nr:protein kinase [Chlamydiia bacterium]
EIAFTLGQYQILDTIGKGGMGEVYRAFDSVCGREVALKEIRADLKKYKRLHDRFLHEARITSQLTHPSIMPIYGIHLTEGRLYYSMPYVKGETLKQRLRRARELRREGKEVGHEAEIPALARIFLAVCQAMAYSHSRGIIHRDLKPENIMLGHYGEVLILDWGLGQHVLPVEEGEGSEGVEVEREDTPHTGITVPGKIVGTLNYMSPERALGDQANESTDIYALGVILFQILSLRMPFHRTSFEEYQEHWQKEAVPDPIEVAPYRDVPRILAHIVKKALAVNPKDRYQSVDDMIVEIENYTEGRSEWFVVEELDTKTKSHWEFQEHIFIADNLAITNRSEESHWVHCMVSKASFTSNTKMEAYVRLGPKSQGIGFLLNVPESGERETPYDGYCLWLGSDINKSTCLLRSSQEVLNASDIFLRRNEWYHLQIEKVGNRLSFFLNNRLELSFVSHLPIVGTHAGLISRDIDYDIREWRASVSSLSLTVDCLAVPDAFLAAGDFDRARSEYYRIAEAFPGRAQGREALFRAGIAYLEEARSLGKDHIRQTELLDQARDAFEQLRATPGAPLEYLGKALVYREERDSEEEVKCYELAYRRYKKHPLLPTLQEQIVYRMHETSRHNRYAAYSLILLALRHIPSVADGRYVHKLLKSLQQHWEPLPFIQEDPVFETNYTLRKHHFAMLLAFWLGRPYVILEIIEDILQEPDLHVSAICNALMCLIELGCTELAKKQMDDIMNDCFDADRDALTRPFALLKIALEDSLSLQEVFDRILALKTDFLRRQEMRVLAHQIELAIDEGRADEVAELFESVRRKELPFDDLLRMDMYRIWAYLHLGRWEEAGEA